MKRYTEPNIGIWLHARARDRRVPGEGLQRKAAALGPGLSLAGAVREHAGEAVQRAQRPRGFRHEDSTQARREGAHHRCREPGGKIAPREKGEACEFPRGAREGAAEVIVRVGVSARKTWTACAQDGGDLGSGRFRAGAVPWRSIYRRCSSPVGGSVRESAAGATNRHRCRRHSGWMSQRSVGAG